MFTQQKMSIFHFGNFINVIKMSKTIENGVQNEKSEYRTRDHFLILQAREN